MNIRLPVLGALVALTSACASFGSGSSLDSAVVPVVTSTDQAMHAFLSGRELAPIEGAWQNDDNTVELVIAKNTFHIAPEYDYVGIVTEVDQSKWEAGDVKVLLRSTETEGVFDGVWVTRIKSRRQMTFVIKSEDVVQASFRTSDGNESFLRIRRLNPRVATSN